MPDRAVKLVIQVDDRDVKEAEKSLDRLGKAAQKVPSTGPLAVDGRGRPLDNRTASEIESQQRKLAAWMEKTLPGAAKTAGTAMAEVETAAEGMAGGLGAASTSGLAVVGAAGAVVLAVGLVAAALYKGAQAAVAITRGFADYHNELERGQRVTGLTINTYAAMRHEAERANVSTGDLDSAVAHLRETMGKANGGNEAARKGLALLGVDAKKYGGDIDAAFTQAAAAIYRMPSGILQARAGFAAFGEDWVKILPLIKEFNGNVPEAIKRAEELGLLMSGKDARGAREFNKAFADAEAAVTGLKNTFAKEFLPAVSRGIQDFTGWLKDNKVAILDWAQWLGDKLKTIIDWWERSAAAVRNYKTASDIAFDQQKAMELGYKLPANYGTPYTPPLPTLDQNDPRIAPQAMRGYNPPNVTAPTPADEAMLEAQRQAEIERLKKQAEYSKKEWDAAIDSARTKAAEAKTTIGELFKTMEEAFEKDKNADSFRAAVRSNLSWYEKQEKALLDHLDNLETEKARRDQAGPQQLQATLDEQQKRRKDYGNKSAEIERQMRDKIASINKKANAEEFAEAEAAMRRRLELYGLRDEGAMSKAAYDHASGTDSFGSYKATERRYLEFRQRQELSSLDYQKQQLQELLGKAVGEENAKRRVDLQGQLNALAQRRQNLTDEQGRQLTPEDQAKKDVTDELNRIRRQDRDEEARTDRTHLAAKRQELALQQQVYDLEDEIRNLGKDDAMVIQIEHMRTVLDLRHRDRDAVIAIDRAQQELNDAMKVSNVQVRAGVYEHIAGQRTMSEAYADGINQTYDALSRLVNGPLDKLNEKSKGLLSFFTEPLKAMQSQAIGNVFLGVVDKLFPGMGDSMKKAQNPMLYHAEKHTVLLEKIAQNTGGLPGGYTPTAGGGIGGIFSSIFRQGRGGGGGGGGFGGGMGPGGTPYFNGNAGGGYDGQGAFYDQLAEMDRNGQSPASADTKSLGMFGGLFEPHKNPFTGKMNSKAAGIAGGVGSIAAMVGGFIPGRGGRVLQYAGMGAQIGANFGLIGAGVGAGIGALIGLLGHRDHAEQKLKEAARSQFGINVTDKSVIRSLISLGEGMFGKGKVGANAVAVVRSEEGQNILKAYAESTGQSSLKIDRLSYGDPNWAGNDFRIGSSSSSSFGGGTFGGGGSSVSIGGGSMSAARFAASAPAGTSSNIHPTLIAGLAESIYQLKDEIATLKSQPAGVIVREGAAHASEELADAVQSSFENNGYRSEQQARVSGQNI